MDLAHQRADCVAPDHLHGRDIWNAVHDVWRFPHRFPENPGAGAKVWRYLPFLSVAAGMMLAVAYTLYDNKRYKRAEASAKADGKFGAPPEARLPPCIIGSVCLPHRPVHLRLDQLSQRALDRLCVGRSALWCGYGYGLPERL